MAQGNRPFEAVVWGGTGYTGKYTAEHITAHLPTDFKWAIAGRSEQKLEKVVEELRKLNPDRQQPSIEVAQLTKDDLVKLARKTKVFISTVGPYHKYGTLAVEACAETGTHYLDVTGETPWVYDMIQKYDQTAKRNGAIMISQIGIESAPADLVSWALVSYIRKTLGVGTAEVVLSTHELKSAPSGGTLATVLSIFDTYSLSHFAKASKRWSMSTVAPPKQSYPKTLLERLTGLRFVKGLDGPLTDSIQGPTDTPIVHRSWSLFDGGKLYGPKFRFSPYMKANSNLVGVAIHFGLAFGMLALVFPPVRWMLKRYVYQPGQGPTKEHVILCTSSSQTPSLTHHREAKNDRVEWRAVANADNSDPRDPKQAFMRFGFNGSMYLLTGIFLAEAAITICRDQTSAHKIGGGMLTPATLGEAFLERLQKAGVQTEVRMMA